MAKITIAQFNLENLFNRYILLADPVDRQSPHVQLVGIANIDYEGNPLSEATTQIQRNSTAQAILENQPDILAVEEVENIWTLRCFNDEYLGGYFDRMILLDGNDGRGINVGLCLKYGSNVEVSDIRTHIDEVYANSGEAKPKRVERYYNSSKKEIVVQNALFSRDCLEVDVNASGKPLTFLINHFKSQDGTKAAENLRKAQASRVAEIAANIQNSGRLPIVIGDLNEDWSVKGNLKALKDMVVSSNTMVDPFVSIEDNWTHYYSVANETSRLDYILIDASLKGAISDPFIFRKGISLKCNTAGERFPTMGYVGTEASDHCPIRVTLNFG